MRSGFRFELFQVMFLAGAMAIALAACGSAALRNADGAAGNAGSGGLGGSHANEDASDGAPRDTSKPIDARTEHGTDAIDARLDSAADAGICGGLAQVCCANEACSVAGSICSSSGTCGCPIGSHACRSSSCISNASLCDVMEFQVPGTTPQPWGLALGPDENVWFSDFKNLKVGRITSTGSIVEYSVSAPPQTIAAGPDGNLWFTEHGHPSGGLDQIGVMNPSGSHLSEYDVSGDSLSTDPGNTLGYGTMIIAGPDGNLWFSESVPGKLARMTTTGVHTSYQIRAFYPEGIAVGPDNNIWYGLIDGAAIGWITLNGTNNTEVPFPNTTDDPDYLAIGPDNDFWITESTSNLITHYNQSTAKFTPYAIPTPSSGVGPIALGPDGNMWSIGFNSNNIIRISTAGAITEFPLPTANSQPIWIVEGPEISGSGTLWISEYGSGKIARVIP